MNKQTRKACGPCIALKAKCDHARPCGRCVGKGCANMCSDVDRKTRPKKAKLNSMGELSEEDVQQIQALAQLLKQQPMTPLQLLQSNIQQLQNLQPAKNLPNTPFPPSPQFPQTPQDTQNLLSQQFQNMQNLQNVQNFQNLQNLQNLQPFQPISAPPGLFTFYDQTQAAQFPQTTTTTTTTTQTFQVPQFSQNPLMPQIPQFPQFSQMMPQMTELPELDTSESSPEQEELFALPRELLQENPSIPSFDLGSSSFESESNTSTPDSSPISPPAEAPSPSSTMQANTASYIHNFCTALAANLHNLRQASNNAPNSNNSGNLNLVTQKLTQIRGMLDKFLHDADVQSGPRGVLTNPPAAIFNPHTTEFIECNEAFAKIVGRPVEAMRGVTLYSLAPEFVSKIIRRDIRYFLQNGITYGERFVSFRHSSGGFVYGRVSFQLIGKDHSVCTFHEMYDEIPPCLKFAYEHYLGLRSVNAPPHQCDRPYCSCKMLHMPFAPEDLAP